jgi:hypothetical protein
VGLAGRALAVLLCVAGVPFLVLALVHAFYGVPISAYRPTINDEVAYWHQTLTFSHAGFYGGYYTLGEVTNPSGLTPFGPHGPGFVVLYGLFGKIFGWHRHTAIILNLIAIGTAGWIWVSLSRLSVPRLLLSAPLLVTFWHIVFWAPTSMQETLHHAGAIVMAACFASALGPAQRRWITASGWIVVGALSFIRPSWIILMPLWAIATTHASRRSAAIATVAGSLVYGAAILFAYSRTSAPYDTGFLFLRAASLSLAAPEIVDNVAANAQRLASPDQFHPIELLERYQYGALLLATTIAAMVTRWQRRGLTPSLSPSLSPHFSIAAAALAVALTAMLVLYQFTNYAEHRVLSAFLLFGTLLCLAAPGRVGPLLAIGILLSNAASARTSFAGFEDGWREHFVWDRRGISELERALEKTVAYRAGASRWCNTLLTSQYPPQLIVVPAGIGLSVVRKPELMTLPPRSHYLLLDAPVRAAFTSPLQLEPVATLPYGTVYINRESGCD